MIHVTGHRQVLHLIVTVRRGVAREPDGGPGEGAAAGQDERSL